MKVIKAVALTMYDKVNPHLWERAALRAASTTFTDNVDNGHHGKNKESQYDGQYA